MPGRHNAISRIATYNVDLLGGFLYSFNPTRMSMDKIFGNVSRAVIGQYVEKTELQTFEGEEFDFEDPNRRFIFRFPNKLTGRD